MKKYHIRTNVNLFYKVEAENYEDALDKVHNSKVEAYEQEVIEDLDVSEDLGVE